MRRLLSFLLLLTLFGGLFAQSKGGGKPNTLPAKMAEDGWLLLFDGETTMGWKIEGEAKVNNQTLILGGKKETHAQTQLQLFESEVRGDFSWVGEKPPTLTIPHIGMNAVELSKKNTSILSGRVRATKTPQSVLRLHVPAGTQLRLQNVRVQPFEFQSLFNGKDLTGWKVFKGNPKQEKSTFTVTKNKVLNIKNGPGDIQTEKTFADFLLQVEGRTNGTHLNSGIFFRALPGKYQQGYEAQIRHQFTDTMQKYAIEHFDPKSHKSLGKKEILSPAVDYGTGAIYRRMPARRGIAKDKEWFVMTVYARGRYFATWVNGVPVAEWTDNRPANDNARQGYRAAAGAISIQGHDPTTDLDFKTIRIVALPARSK